MANRKSEITQRDMCKIDQYKWYRQMVEILVSNWLIWGGGSGGGGGAGVFGSVLGEYRIKGTTTQICFDYNRFCFWRAQSII